MGISIRTEDVRQGLWRQNAELERIVAGIDLTESKIGAYIDEGGLKGEAFDAHKAYMETGHLEFLGKYKMALEATMEANDTHINVIDTQLSSDYYNEANIENEISCLERQIRRIDFLRTIKPTIRVLNFFGVDPFGHQRAIDSLSTRLDYLRDKLARLHSYIYETAVIYTSAEDQFVEANRLLMVLETATRTHCPETGILIVTMLSVDDAEIQFLINIKLRNEDGKICWNTVREMFGRGFDNLSENELDALSYLYMSIDDPNELARFINAMAVSIGPGPSIFRVSEPESLSAEERSAFSEPNAGWRFDLRFATAINDRARESALSNHEHNWGESVFNSVVSTGVGFVPIVGDVVGVATGVAGPFVDAARIDEVRNDINAVADAGNLSLSVERRGLNGVFISENGNYAPTQLWFSPVRPGEPEPVEYTRYGRP